jgi:hypothetical protein
MPNYIILDGQAVEKVVRSLGDGTTDSPLIPIHMVNIGGVAKGTTVEGSVTTTPAGDNHQCIDATLYDGAGNPVVFPGLGTAIAPYRFDPTGATTQPTRHAVGIGNMTTVPSPSANGTAIGTMPAGAVGVRIYLSQGEALTFTIQSAAPTSAPANTYTIGFSTTGPNWDENLTGTMMYITARTGSPKFRWI